MRARFGFNPRSLVPVALLLALGLFTAPSAFATTTTVSVPVTSATFSGCVPPGASASGHMKVTFRFNVNLNGMHVGMESNSCGTKIVVPGVGEFVSKDVKFNETNTSFNNAATEFTFHESFRYSSPGSGENYRLDAQMHVTVNANGEVTAEFTRIHVDCYVECCGGAGEIVE